ncbi:MAG: N-acetylmuramoyl-L-alanine amidase [Campylobacteraceae bacterium]|nr:N-acetylmuramoyl-L-alanine amidase [Campylobacteraceae bacterium]
MSRCEKYDVGKYKYELKKLNKNTPSKKKIVKKTVKKPTKKVKKTKTLRKHKSNYNSKYTIQDVYVQNNMIIIDFNTRITSSYLTFFEQKYSRLTKDVFNIVGTFKEAKQTKLKMNNVHRITVSQFKKDRIRIVLSNKTNLKTLFRIKKNRIIIEVTNIPKSKNRTRISPLMKKRYSFKRNKIVVIDAGHGGKDSGAIGPGKKYEKHAVLKVAKNLYKILKKEGYKVYITRTSDRFIKVRNRTILANKKRADIFISIHANAAPKAKASWANGIETFFLSPARSDRAKRIAAKENKSDMRKMDYSTKSSFLTILNRPKITASQKLAIDVQKNILYRLRKSYKNVKDSGVREGPFWVLVGAQMPSILVEIGYITHPLESKRLYSRKYQLLLAKGIAKGVNSYFAKNP